jgi:membrane-bound lytic murein transglycosylase MltF
MPNYRYETHKKLDPWDIMMLAAPLPLKSVMRPGEEQLIRKMYPGELAETDIAKHVVNDRIKNKIPWLSRHPEDMDVMGELKDFVNQIRQTEAGKAINDYIQTLITPLGIK